MAELDFNVSLGDNKPEKAPLHSASFSSASTADRKDTSLQEVALQVALPYLVPGAQQQQQQSQSKVALCGFFSVEYYQPYFNLTTLDVQERIKSSLNPIKPRFFELTQANPDLYGPVWIYTTLILVLAAAGNTAQLTHSESNNTSYYSFVATAASIVYGYGFLFPIVLTILLKVFGSNTISYVQTICCYGYSCFIFIPAFILAAFPYSMLQWIVIIAAIANSTLFLVTNYGHELGKYVGKQRYILMGFIGASQTILLLIFKLHFFTVSSPEK